MPVRGLYARNCVLVGPWRGRYFYESTVDDIDNSVNSDACFGDVGGYDDFSLTFFGGLEDC